MRHPTMCHPSERHPQRLSERRSLETTLWETPWRTIVLFGLLALLVAPGICLAQHDNYEVGLALGLGGSTDDEPDTGLDNFSWQASFAMKIDSKTQWGARLGQLELDTDDAGASGGDLSYVTLSGEYLFPEGFYESGVYLGLGFYDFSGDVSGADDSGVGLVLGVTGDFRLTERLGLSVELSGHGVDLEGLDFLLMGHVGLAYRF